jgi:lipopolysaccharide transport system permease protein
MIKYSISPLELYKCFWRNKSLIKALIRRDVLGRYQGSVIGVLWSFLIPLFMLTVYTVVFSVVFNARWNTASESKTEFALILFAGLLVFNLFADCLNRAPTLILNNQNYVKKVVFPIEILPIVVIVFVGVPNETVFYLPIVIIPFSFFIMGLSWFVASLGVYLRDVNQFMGLLTTVLMFLSPIFYPVSALPEGYKKLIYLNPLAYIIEQVRNVMFFGVAPKFIDLALYFLASMLISWLGFVWFQKTRGGFSDVL